MVETNVLIGTGIGFFFGFLIGWLVGVTKKERKQDIKKELSADALAFLQQKEPFDTFDVHVARVDVEREAMIGVMHHIDDMVEELREDAELHHVLRLVILGYDGEGDKLTVHKDLCDHFRRIHEERPYLPVFFDRRSMRLYLLFLLKGRKNAGLIPQHPQEPPLERLEQEIVGHTTQLLASILAEKPEAMAKLLDMLLGRLEKVCEEMQQEEQARLNAALQSGSSTK